MRKIFFFLFLLSLSGVSYSRDIDLDSIYISDTSSVYSNIISEKYKAYSDAGARAIAPRTIFARWISGSEILYIKEFRSLNIIYRINLTTSEVSEIKRISGTVSFAELGRAGRLLYLKLLTEGRSLIPSSYLVIVNTVTGRTFTRRANNPFQDFTLSPSSGDLIYESRKGISSADISAGTVHLILPLKRYSAIRRGSDFTLARISPNRKHFLLLNGSGGSYRALCTNQGHDIFITGISSLAETRWLNSDSIIYRSGTPGNYGIYIYRISSGKKLKLYSGSLNTNLCLSPAAGKASYLDNQLIRIYDISSSVSAETGLEGEDVFFSPDGSRFLSLFHGTLFVTHQRRLFGIRQQSSIRKKARRLIYLYTQAGKDLSIQTSGYSSSYIIKKISAYRRYLQNR